jgi:hypothetical protein
MQTAFLDRRLIEGFAVLDHQLDEQIGKLAGIGRMQETARIAVGIGAGLVDDAFLNRDGRGGRSASSTIARCGQPRRS